MFRTPETHEIVYVGMAGERAASGTPQGLHGRLTAYQRGRGAVSGFGEAALDRALSVAGDHTRQAALMVATAAATSASGRPTRGLSSPLSSIDAIRGVAGGRRHAAPPVPDPDELRHYLILRRVCVTWG